LESRGKNPFTLVDSHIDIDLDAKEVAAIEIDLAARERARSPRDLRVPFSIWITTEQILDVAEDADVRAMMLELTARRIKPSADVLRKVSALRDAARGLGRIAARLRDGWDGSRGSS